MGEQNRRDPEVGLGSTVYDDDDNELGTVRGFDEHGFYVSIDEGVDAMSVEHIRSGQEFGEAELMWRCWECGEMGEIDDEFPDNCPACEAPREEIYYWTED